MKRVFVWTSAVLAALLLAGCQAMDKPASAPTASPAQVAESAQAKATEAPTPLALPTVAPAPTSPMPYTFPMAATGLFGTGSAPEDLGFPLYISGDGTMFLVETTDGRIVKETWDATGYKAVPVAENVDANGTAVYLDTSKNRLCCAGSKLYAPGRTGPAPVVVDLATGARCNADELCSWKKEDCALSGKFQYCGGIILAQTLRFTDGAYIPTDRWMAVNVDAKTCSTVDMEGFAQKNLPDWQNLISYRLALTGPDSMLAVCLVQRQSAGVAQYGCFAIAMDLKGHTQAPVEIPAASGKPQELALPQAQQFHASPDGKYVLYADAQGNGVYLYDIAAGREYAVQGTAGRACAFAQWGTSGEFYYGVETIGGGQILIQKTSLQETEKQ